MKSAGVKSAVINSPAADLAVPFGGLAMLDSLAVSCEAVEA
jgi:hypothetical protein